MKNITDIFEGIFDQNTDQLENSAMIDDPNSEFNKEWTSQFNDTSELKIKFDNPVLHIDGKHMFGFTINLETPVTKFIPDVKETVFERNTVIYMHGRNFDKTFFGGVIQVNHGSMTIINAPVVDGIEFKTNIYSNVECSQCNLFKNCIIKNTDSLLLKNDNGICTIKNCDAPDIRTIEFKGANIFKTDWQPLIDVIDWDAIKAPIDVKTSRSIDLSKKSLQRLVSAVKYVYKYDWRGKGILPLKEMGNKLTKKLFPDCDFSSLKKITIEDNDTLLVIDYCYGGRTQCEIMNKKQKATRPKKMLRR